MECIIQSTGYSDLLAITLAHNRDLIDKIRVYTKTGDEATKAVCARLGIECIETDAFTKGGARFNRGASYNESFRHLTAREWVLILDSDILLPLDFKARIAEVTLDRECFYGVRRYNIETYADYQRVKADPAALQDYTLYRGFGYGYFQLFHYQSAVFQYLLPNAYPEHVDGSEADWRFRNVWGDIVYNPPLDDKCHEVPNPRDMGTGLLRCLPFNVIHLGITGVNSTGRHTPLFQ